MQCDKNCLEQLEKKDEIIKRQALEIACLVSRIANQEDEITKSVMDRTADLVNSSQDMADDRRRLETVLNNVLKALKVLCPNESERLKFLLAMGLVDEEWYRSEYPDVAQNYPKGALHHFCKFGIFEGRKPNSFMSA